ncbi:MAG: translesion error-prone DNA polymerase V autoproteolytic subunit [Prevotellaceae bacterium]|nr:translesion error-prone DNA polymerase V autoproteolytic subunit [Prevotellaceae bacterium]
MEPEIKLILYSADLSNRLELQYADGGIRAGFPSPAQDYLTESIDLNEELIRHPATTFYARAVGNSMTGDGIDDGDLLVIDKSLEPQEGNIIVAFVNGEYTLKRFHYDKREGCVWLLPANSDYPPIKVTKENDFMIWGVLTYNIKSQLHRK